MMAKTAASWNTNQPAAGPCLPEGVKNSAEDAGRRDRRPVAPLRGGRAAVDEADAAPPRRDEVLGEPHAHKITRPGERQPGLEAFEHLVHHWLRLPPRQPADGEAGPLTELLDPPQTFLA